MRKMPSLNVTFNRLPSDSYQCVLCGWTSNTRAVHDEHVLKMHLSNARDRKVTAHRLTLMLKSDRRARAMERERERENYAYVMGEAEGEL